MPRFIINARLEKLKDKFYRRSFSLGNLNSRAGLLLLFVAIFVAGLFYLVQVNGLATKGYQIRDLENKVAVLKETNKKLEVEVTELRSTARVNQEIEKLNMVTVARFEYLRANGTSVAINR
jgi:cell division protein FtsL